MILQTVQKNNNQTSTSKQEQKLESKKGIVKNSIRICVECGSQAVKINNLGLYCKDCNSFFKLEAN